MGPRQWVCVSQPLDICARLLVQLMAVDSSQIRELRWPNGVPAPGMAGTGLPLEPRNHAILSTQPPARFISPGPRGLPGHAVSTTICSVSSLGDNCFASMLEFFRPGSTPSLLTSCRDGMITAGAVQLTINAAPESGRVCGIEGEI